MQKIKAIHAVMRAAGYERQTTARVIGGKIYKTENFYGNTAVIIPGNWSIALMERYRNELMEVLKDFSPAKSYFAGVEIKGE